MMVVPGSAPLIQQDHALEPGLGRGSTESPAMGPNTAPVAGEVGPELEEVRKLRELVRRLELENQHPRTKGSRSVLGTAVQSEICPGVGNHDSGLNGMEINNSINAITEKQELQIMVDLHNQLSKIRKEEGENCFKKDIDAQVQYNYPSAAEELSPDRCEVEVEENIRRSSRADTGDGAELVGNSGLVGLDPSVKINHQNPPGSRGEAESLSGAADLDEVKVLELETCSEAEDSW